ARNHQVVYAFAPDRADHPLHVSALPRRARRDRVIADAHRANAPGVSRPERAIAVTEQMSRRPIPREGFGHLTSNPFRRWVRGDSDPDQPSASVVKNHQTIEQLERDGADHEEIDRSYSCDVIVNAGAKVHQQAGVKM